MSTRGELGRTLVTSVLIAATVAFLLALFVYDPTGAIDALPSDDAFYYLEIAQNITAGHGSTFDRIAPTNGYHPLWMGVVVAIYSLAGSSLELPVLLLLALSGVIAATSLYFVHRLVDEFVAPGFGTVALATCLLPNLLTAMLNGMETGILLLAVVFWLWFCFRTNAHLPVASAMLTFTFGVLLAVVFLCRLDSVFIVAAVGCLNLASGLALRLPFSALLKRFAVMGVGFTMVAGPYVVTNLVTYGHLMPISGSVKSTIPSIREPLTFHGDMLFGAVALAAILSLFAFIIIVDRRRGQPFAEIISSPLSILSAACAMHFLHVFLFLSWGVYWWHFALSGITLALLFPAALARALATRPSLRPLAAAVCATSLVIIGVVIQVQLMSNKAVRHAAWRRAAEWARSHSDPKDVFAIKDAGLFGYFSNRSVINLDGKANGWEFHDYVARGDVEGYLSKSNVKFIADINCDYSDGSYAIVIPRPGQLSLVLAMNERSLLYQGDPFPDRLLKTGARHTSHVAIWKYPDALSSLE